MAKTHEIDGKIYVEVERQAEVGEKVIYVYEGKSDGIAREVINVGVSSVEVDPFYDEEDGEECYGFAHGAYRLLIPIADKKELNDLLSQITPENRHEEWPPLTESALELTANDIRWQPERVIDLLANLARRVSSLERQVDSLSTQLKDTQGNVERQAEELENEKEYRTLLYRKVSDIKDQVERNESDIVMLDERTSSHRDELNVIDHEKAMIFEDIVSLSQRIRKLNGGAAE